MKNQQNKTEYPDAYLKYQERQERLDLFYNLAELSVLFTAFSLSEMSLDGLKKIKIPRPDLKKLSMIPRAARPKEVRLRRGWITYEEYSKESGLEIHQVEESARDGKLGPVTTIPETNEDALFWPPEEHSKALSELPPPTKKKTYVVTMETDALISLNGEWEGEETKETFLKLASSHGDPEESSGNALALLRQVCFIQEWTSFEVYIREVVAYLLRKHPEKIAASGRGKKILMSTDEVVELSQRFTSIEELRERMVQREIERRQAEGQSVHGLINFLKDEFRFERDPYCEPYLFRGKRLTTHYNDITEIKDVRNALIHDGGLVPISFFEGRPRIPHDSGKILISDDYYLTVVLILRSISLGIAESISRDQYVAD
jgi:hypothetical protein